MVTGVTEQQKAKRDLVILIFATLIPLIIYLFFESVWNIQGRDESINFWLRFWSISLAAYGLAGFGMTIVFLYRKERFSDYGLVRKNAVLAIGLSVLVFVPHYLFMFFTGDIERYMPLNGTVLTDSVLRRPFPQNVFCMALLGLIWGFFEGMNYVFIGKKINVIVPPRKWWLDFGGIFGGIVCVLVHKMVGLDFLTMVEGITVFVFVYGIIVIRNRTGNAWGCVVSFLFLWNAF